MQYPIDARAQLGAAQMNGTLVAGAGIPVGTARSKVELVTQTKTGTTFMAEVFYAENGTMIGLTPQSHVGTGADQLTAGVRYVPSTTSGTDIGWAAGGLQPYNGAGVALYRQTADTLPYTDPLSLDQGDDGIRFSPVPVSFDANGDGVSESLPWPISVDTQNLGNDTLQGTTGYDATCGRLGNVVAANNSIFILVAA